MSPDLVGVPDELLLPECSRKRGTDTSRDLLVWLNEHQLRPSLLDVENERARRRAQQTPDRPGRTTPRGTTRANPVVPCG